MRPIYKCSKIFGSPWLCPWLYFSRNFNGLFFRLMLFEVRSFTCSWDNRGYRKNGQFLNAPKLPFLQNFYGHLFEWTLWMFRPNLKFVALHVPKIIGGTPGVPLWIRPRSLFFEILMGFCSDEPVNVPATFELRSFNRSWVSRFHAMSIS